MPKQPPVPKVPGLSGIPESIVLYYHKNGLPGEVVSVREVNSVKDDTMYVSILFKGYKFRHKWNSANKASAYSKARIDDWVLDMIPI